MHDIRQAHMARMAERARVIEHYKVPFCRIVMACSDDMFVELARIAPHPWLERRAT